MIKVILADDHQMIREGLRQLLELGEEIKVVAEVSDGVQCMEILKKQEADVLLLDINMPNKNGLEVLKEIHSSKIDIKVLILTIHGEIEYLLKAIELGINGYMLKDSESKELKEAIKTIYESKSYIQPSLIPLLNVKLVEKDIDKVKINSLTKRELEVLKLVSEGLFNKEIANRLDISERTVKNHISNIFKKIDVADRTQAAVFTIKNNLIGIY